MSLFLDLKSLRAKKGNGAEKAKLLKEYSSEEAVLLSLCILSCGNENSTYKGAYPKGVGSALNDQRKKIKSLEEKIRGLCN